LVTIPVSVCEIAEPGFRRLIVRALNGRYVVDYRVDGQRVVILRIFHGR
jgi:hypothetical protein